MIEKEIWVNACSKVEKWDDGKWSGLKAVMTWKEEGMKILLSE